MLLCAKGPLVWDSMDGTHRVSLDMPRTADVLYLFSRGMSISGNVVVVQDESLSTFEGGEERDTVVVDIVAKGATPLWFHVFAVCALERKPGETGIGIFVSGNILYLALLSLKYAPRRPPQNGAQAPTSPLSTLT